MAVSGNDLIEMGYEGREIGSVLDKLLEKVIDGELENSRKALEEYLMSL